MEKVKLITHDILSDLISAVETSNSIYFIVSFVMDSGVRLLEDSLQAALQKGAEVKILSGDYFYVTQPEGLRRLIDIDDRIEVWLWNISFSSKRARAGC